MGPSYLSVSQLTGHLAYTIGTLLGLQQFLLVITPMLASSFCQECKSMGNAPQGAISGLTNPRFTEEWTLLLRIQSQFRCECASRTSKPETQICRDDKTQAHRISDGAMSRIIYIYISLLFDLRAHLANNSISHCRFLTSSLSIVEQLLHQHERRAKLQWRP